MSKISNRHMLSKARESAKKSYEDKIKILQSDNATYRQMIVQLSDENERLRKELRAMNCTLEKLGKASDVLESILFPFLALRGGDDETKKSGVHMEG